MSQIKLLVLLPVFSVVFGCSDQPNVTSSTGKFNVDEGMASDAAGSSDMRTPSNQVISSQDVKDQVSAAAPFNAVIRSEAETKPYLMGIKSAFNSVKQTLVTRFSVIDRVDSYAIQDQLQTLLTAPNYSAAERERYLTLQRYFAVIRGVQAALKAGSPGSFFTDFSDVIDPKTGQWTISFSAFAAKEGLKLPAIMIVRALGINPDVMTTAQMSDEYDKSIKIVGTNVGGYFNGLLNEHPDKLADITRSMRKVKLTLRLNVPKSPFAIRQFLKNDNVYVSGNPPDFAAAGFDVKLRGWSKWFFLATPYANCVMEPIATTLARIEQYYNKESLFYIDDFYYGCESAGLDKPALIRGVLTAIRDKYPGAIIGFYAFLPRHDYWDAMQAPTHPDNIAWKADNEARRAAVGDMIDMLMPSFYFPYTIPSPTDPKMAEWKKSRTAIVAEAKRVAALHHNQPVIPFVFPVFYNTSYSTYCRGDVYRAAMDHLINEGVSAVIQYNEQTAWQSSFNNPTDGVMSWYEALFMK